MMYHLSLIMTTTAQQPLPPQAPVALLVEAEI